jgi:hypothetical protein
MTIRRAKANSNVIEINDLRIEPRASAGDANRHLWERLIWWGHAAAIASDSFAGKPGYHRAKSLRNRPSM